MGGPMLARKAVEWLNRQTAERPFFMYYAASCPHGPLYPAKTMDGKKVEGSTTIGPRADYVYEFDVALGMLLRALDEKGMTDNTLVVVTSDNGATKAIRTKGFPAARKLEEPAGHYSNGSTRNAAGRLRGQKADIWEGGHRVPFIVRWPGRVEAGTDSDQLIGLHDFMAMIADIVGYTLKEKEAPDSFSFLSVLTNEAAGPVRNHLLNQSGSGVYALREGRMKLIFGDGPGGFSGGSKRLHKDTTHWKQWQLYDLAIDPAEKQNLINDPAYRDMAHAMWKRFGEYRGSLSTREMPPVSRAARGMSETIESEMK
jgi:arylsulfatase A-like enzyme